MADPGLADNPDMVGPGRWRARLVLGFALWASLPSLQWCPFSWETSWKACEAGGAVPMRAMACGPMAGATCEAMLVRQPSCLGKAVMLPRPNTLVKSR